MDTALPTGAEGRDTEDTLALPAGQPAPVLGLQTTERPEGNAAGSSAEQGRRGMCALTLMALHKHRALLLISSKAEV